MKLLLWTLTFYKVQLQQRRWGRERPSNTPRTHVVQACRFSCASFKGFVVDGLRCLIWQTDERFVRLSARQGLDACAVDPFRPRLRRVVTSGKFINLRESIHVVDFSSRHIAQFSISLAGACAIARGFDRLVVG